MGDLRRFVLADELNIEQPWPTGQRRHYDAGTTVTVDADSALFERIKDVLRLPDGRDAAGQAGVLLRQG